MKQQAVCHRYNLLCKQNSTYTHGISAKKLPHPTPWHSRKPQLQPSGSQSNANILALKKISPDIKTFFFLFAWSISIKHTGADTVDLPCPNQLSGYSGDASYTAELVCWSLLTCFPSQHCLYFFNGRRALKHQENPHELCGSAYVLWHHCCFWLLHPHSFLLL